MSTANSASRKRAFIEEGDSENDKNVANKRFKTIQKSTVNVPPIFGDVNVSHCFLDAIYSRQFYLKLNFP